nr:MAG TPA: hypothetical protein [Caudoviricetes sp.]
MLLCVSESYNFTGRIIRPRSEYRIIPYRQIQ